MWKTSALQQDRTNRRRWSSPTGRSGRLLGEGRIEIDPYDEALLQPSSVDVRVDRYFRVFRNSRYPFIDVKQEQEELTELVEIDDETPFILHPGEFVLGSTLERIRLPDDLVARLEGKSSLGRLGLLIHSTAGFIDPGWDGHVTLELSNVANLPITIYFGMKIGQISFVQMTEPAETPYGVGRRSAPSTRASRGRRRAATGRTSSHEDPRHRRDRLRRARTSSSGSSTTGHTVRVLERTAAGASAGLPSQEAVQGDDDRRGEPAARGRGPGRGRPPRRDPHRQARRSSSG